jgi:pimeloyl-ACP methyl ester carboxylesterase
MVTLIARLGVDRVHWFGTSMGGLIGMALAALPDTPIERMVLNDVGPVVTLGPACGASPNTWARRRSSRRWTRPNATSARSARLSVR